MLKEDNKAPAGFSILPLAINLTFLSFPIPIASRYFVARSPTVSPFDSFKTVSFSNDVAFTLTVNSSRRPRGISICLLYWMEGKGGAGVGFVLRDEDSCFKSENGSRVGLVVEFYNSAIYFFFVKNHCGAPH